jgi:hypothetical protein
MNGSAVSRELPVDWSKYFEVENVLLAIHQNIMMIDDEFLQICR